AILTLAVSTPVPSALTRTLTLASMTRLTATNTFISELDLLSSRGSLPQAQSRASRALEQRARPISQVHNMEQTPRGQRHRRPRERRRGPRQQFSNRLYRLSNSSFSVPMRLPRSPFRVALSWLSARCPEAPKSRVCERATLVTLS